MHLFVQQVNFDLLRVLSGPGMDYIREMKFCVHIFHFDRRRSIHTFTITAILSLMSVAGRAQQRWTKEKSELIATSSDFKQCHASTILEYAPGKMMAAWFGGTGEGNNDVTIWLTGYADARWSKPVSIANGVDSNGTQYPCWNPVLFLDQSDKIHLYYKVGPNPRKWWGMEIVSTDKGKTWSAPVRLPSPFLGPIRNKPIQLADGTILSPSSVETDNKWTAHIERSTDGGKKWEFIPIDHASVFEVIQPTILQYTNGDLQALFRSKQGTIAQSWSKDKGKTWTALTKTSLQNPNSGIDAVSLKDGSQLLVYNPDVPGKEWSNGRAKLNVAISKDGMTWKEILILENGTKEEYSYPAVIQTQDNKVHILYTYDRRNIRHIILQSR